MTNKPPRPTASNTRARGRAVQSARRSNRWLWLLGAGVLVAIPLIIFVVANGGQVGPVGDIEGVQTFPNISAGHQEGTITYEQTPPAGGPHNAAWQNCGTYNNPIANENAVHSLEHGAVWITYRPDLPAEAVEQLKTEIHPV